jgi:hypothetical protein
VVIPGLLGSWALTVAPRHALSCSASVCACASLGLKSQVSLSSPSCPSYGSDPSSPCPWQRAYCMYVISASIPSHWNAAISDLLPADYWDNLPYLTYLTSPAYLQTTVLPRTRLRFLFFSSPWGRARPNLGSIDLPSPHLPSIYVNSLPALPAPYAIRA